MELFFHHCVFEDGVLSLNTSYLFRMMEVPMGSGPPQQMKIANADRLPVVLIAIFTGE
jgi:hypothetical protein